MTSVLQDWVQDLTMMQQSVLLTAVRGPDALPKYHASKYLLRWYRRCILLSAMDQRVLKDPMEPNGGSFTGPSVKVEGLIEGQETYLAHGSLRDGQVNYCEGAVWRDSWQEAMDDWVFAYIRGLDEVPHHYQLHFLHAAEIVGYKHPDAQVHDWWQHQVYFRLCKDMHLLPEPALNMDHRLGDDRDQWLAHADTATHA